VKMKHANNLFTNTIHAETEAVPKVA
jgi:hypothetical protein